MTPETISYRADAVLVSHNAMTRTSSSALISTNREEPTMDITRVETAAINRSKVVIARGYLAGYKGFVTGYGLVYDSIRIYLTDDNGDIFDKVSVGRSQVDLVTTPETIDTDKEEARQAIARAAAGHTPDPNAGRKTPEPAV